MQNEYIGKGAFKQRRTVRQLQIVTSSLLDAISVHVEYLPGPNEGTVGRARAIARVCPKHGSESTMQAVDYIDASLRDLVLEPFNICAAEVAYCAEALRRESERRRSRTSFVGFSPTYKLRSRA